MRAKQSSTASGMYRRSGTLTAPITILGGAAPPLDALPALEAEPADCLAASAPPSDGVAEAEGLIHDARNLMNALGLYCDLLSMPGVLKDEHLHYARELRLLADRSAALIGRLNLGAEGAGCVLSAETGGSGPSGVAVGEDARSLPAVSLRATVERCSGLLSRVAGGRTIEVSYGPAASMPVAVTEEAVERILVNLVRNSAAAIERGEAARGWARTAEAALAPRTVLERIADGTADVVPGSIRVGVGLLASSVGESRAWPFLRVKLTVEDFGCGMAPEELKRMIEGAGAPAARRGIGFAVVRQLLTESRGEVKVMSAPGVGTRVQVEWPVAAGSGQAQEAARPVGRYLRRRGDCAAGEPSALAAEISSAGFARLLDRSAASPPKTLWERPQDTLGECAAAGCSTC